MENTEAKHPRTVYDFYGNKRLEVEIFDALNSNRMHHAWIFHGPKGIGKATMAYRVARFFLGAKQFGDAPLSVDENDKVALSIENQSNPDLRVASHYCPHEQKVKNVVSVHAIRDMNLLFQQRANNPYGRRIAIIEDADDLNDNAANALLKSLEEPPAGGLIILIVNSLGKVLPTIRSRCRLFEFRPMSVQTIRQHLPSASIGTLILSGGTFGNAQRLQQLDIDGLYRDFSNAIGAFPKQNLMASLKFANFATDFEKSDIAFELISNWMRRANSAAIGMTIDEIEPGESANMARIVSSFSEEQWYKISRLLVQMRQQIDTNLDKNAAVLNVVNAFFEKRVAA